MNPRLALIRLLCLLVIGMSSAHAALLRFSFDDPVGDATGSIDVTGLTFTFESLTGAYTIDLFASATDPFSGTFRINVNLFNPDTGTTAPNPSLFSDTANDITLPAPETMLSLTGSDSRLLSWNAGDRVAIGSVPFGDPDGVRAFGSSVIDFPLDEARRDLIGTTSVINGSAEAVAVITAVPEPPTLLLALAALSGLCFFRSRKALAGPCALT